MCVGVCIYKIVPDSYVFCGSNVTLSKRVDTVRVTVLNHIYTMDISAEKLFECDLTCEKLLGECW